MSHVYVAFAIQFTVYGQPVIKWQVTGPKIAGIAPIYLGIVIGSQG